METPRSSTEWLDVSIDEIKQDINNGDVPLALDKAKKRFEALWRLRIRDIDRVDPEDLETTEKEEWVLAQNIVKIELEELAQILIAHKYNVDEVQDQLQQLQKDQ